MIANSPVVPGDCRTAGIAACVVARATLAVTLVLGACAPGVPGDGIDTGQRNETADVVREAESILAGEVARIDTAAASADSIFQPLPLLTPAQKEALRTFSNAQQLAQARALGVGRDLPSDSLASLEREGGLVRLADTRYWVVRGLDYSQPLVVPGVVDLLTRIGERFQARLTELGAPPFRFEVSSVLRTRADQEALRRVNPNAALGESTHEYGTTVDILYSAYAAPTEPIAPLDAADADWLEPFLRRYADVSAERVAARRALELKAVLGLVLLELQRDGDVMVTLERQQPVFHLTVAR
jgi:hypothetical protein